MDTLALKIILTPLLFGAVSLAGRRWGPAVSGSLVALPLTSAPVLLFLALDHGLRFAAATAGGILAGTISGALFCLVYARLARHTVWALSTAVATLGYAVCTLALHSAALALPLLVASVLVALAAALWLMPPGDNKPSELALPWWDLPARILIATSFIIAITALAPALGPHLSGLITPFPLFTTILAAFAHAQRGPAQAISVMRGVVTGLMGTTFFFWVVAAWLPQLGIALTFSLAVGVTLLAQTLSLRALSGRGFHALCSS